MLLLWQPQSKNSDLGLWTHNWDSDLGLRTSGLSILFLRMETLFRLLISALGVPWKAYIMATDYYFFPYLLSKDQECFCMNIFYSLLSVGLTIYHTGGSLIRYLYVKASLRPEVAVGFMSRKTFYVCLFIPQVLLLLHFADVLIIFNTKKDFPMLLYQACINPESDYSLPFTQFLPFQVTMMYIYAGIMIYCNIFLWIFLKYIHNKQALWGVLKSSSRKNF